MAGWRILLLNTQMEAGGAQKASLELARGLRSLGHQVIVATFYDKGYYVHEFSERYSVQIIDLQMKKPGSPIAQARHVLHGLSDLRQVLVNEEINILQAFDFYSNALGPLVAHRSDVDICVTSQRSASRGAKKWLRVLIRIITNSRLVDMMTAVSGYARIESMEEGIKPEKLVTIYNGVDVERFNISLSPSEERTLRHEIGVTESTPIVSCVARLYPVKGHKYLVDAISTVVDRMPAVHFLFIGDGPLRDSLEVQINEAGLSEVVHLLGARSDVPKLLAISELHVLASLWEGLPNALLEAMAARLPVVSTDVGGCSEVVVNGKTGILVPPSNAASLANAILTLLEDNALAKQLGNAGQLRVREHFSWSQNLEGYVKLYSGLLAEHSR